MSVAPLRLSETLSVDPSLLRAGVAVLGERSVVDGPFAEEGGQVHWRLRDARGHDQELWHIPAASSQGRERIMHALACLGPEAECLVGYGPCGDGVLVITQPDGAQPVEPATLSESRRCALLLAELVTRLHRADICGVRPTVSMLVRSRRGLYLRGFGFLVDPTELADDVAHLGAELQSLGLSPPGRTSGTAWSIWSWLGGLGGGGRVVDLPAMAPFVGRRMLLTELQRARYRARLGAGGVAGIRGPRGAGKTRLMERAAALFERESPATVVFVRARPDQNMLSELWRGVLASVARWAPDRRAELRRRMREGLGSGAVELAGLSAELDRFLGHPQRRNDATLAERLAARVGVNSEALQLLGTRQRPLLLLIDDLHVCDATSLAVLEDLACSVRGSHVLVVVASRAALPSFVHEKHELGPLLHHELIGLLDGLFLDSDEDREAIARALLTSSEGWPLAAWTTIQEWAERGYVDRNTDGWRFIAPPQPVADTPDDVCRRRLSRLSSAAAAVLGIMVARGGTCRTDWLAEVAGVQRDLQEAAVAELVDAGLVLPVSGGAYGLSHATVSESVLAFEEPQRLREAHRLIADWLDRSPGARLEQRAWHREYASGSEADDVLAQMHVEAGQDLLEQHAIDRAIWHFATGLARAADATLAKRARRGFAKAAALLGDVESTVTYAGMVLDAETTDPVEAVRFAAEIVDALFRQGELGHAADIAGMALARVGEPVPRNPLEGLWIAGSAYVATLVWTPSGNEELRDALCGMYSAMVPTFAASHPGLVLSAAFRARWLAGDMQTANAAAARAFFEIVSSGGGQRSGWEAGFARELAVAEGVGDDWTAGLVHHLWGETELSAGNYERGQQRLEAAVQQFKLAGDHSVTSLSLILRLLFGRYREDSRQLLEWVDEAASINRRNHNLFGQLFLDAYRLWLTGSSSVDALELSARALGGPNNFPSADQALAHAYLAMHFAECGDLERASSHLERMHASRTAMAAMPPYMRDTDEAIVRVVLARGASAPGDHWALRKARWAILATGGAHSRTALRVLDARLAVQRGDLDTGRRLVGEVIGSAGVHHQRRLVIEAHRLMAQWSGADVLVAREHRRVADELESQLGRPERALDIPIAPPPPPSGAVPVRGSLDLLWPRLAEALGDDMEIAIDLPPASLRTAGFPEGMRYIIINLVFAARDATPKPGTLQIGMRKVSVSQQDAAVIPGGRSGNYVVAELEARGAGPPRRVFGLSALREALLDYGGFIDVQRRDDALVLRAYIQSMDRSDSAVEVVVVHPDPATRRAVGTALNGLGVHVRCSEGQDADIGAPLVISPDPPQGPHDRWIPLIRRGDPPVEGALRFPFAVDELKRLLEGGPTPSA